jgi:predicted RNase H-like HicB family nuclease
MAGKISMSDLYKAADSILEAIWIDARRQASEAFEVDKIAEIWLEAHQTYHKIRKRLDDFDDAAAKEYEFHKFDPPRATQRDRDEMTLKIFGNEGWLRLTPVFEACEEGGFHVSLKEVTGVHSQGETLKEAEQNVMDALRTLIDHRLAS